MGKEEQGKKREDSGRRDVGRLACMPDDVQ